MPKARTRIIPETHFDFKLRGGILRVRNSALRPVENPMPEPSTLKEIAEFRDDMRDSLTEVIVGQQDALDHVLVALLTGGHVLLTGGAATAKGLLVQCISKTAQLDFKRVQFTPDLM